MTVVRDWKTHNKLLMKNPKFRKAWEEVEVEYKIAREVIRARLQKGLTQKQVAEKMHTKQSVISRLESGQSTPSITILKRLAKALKVPLKLEVSFG